MRRDPLLAAMAMASLALGNTVVLRAAPIDDEDIPPPKAPRKPVGSSTAAPKVHQHKREIARRLRQQARLAEKLALSRARTAEVE